MSDTYEKMIEIITDTYNEISKDKVNPVLPDWRAAEALKALKKLCILIGVHEE
jgi:hypothetical protein